MNNLLCSSSELDWLKKAVREIDEATRILKKSNDEAPNLRPPSTPQEWREYGKKHPNW